MRPRGGPALESPGEPLRSACAPGSVEPGARCAQGVGVATTVGVATGVSTGAAVGVAVATGSGVVVGVGTGGAAVGAAAAGSLPVGVAVGAGLAGGVRPFGGGGVALRPDVFWCSLIKVPSRARLPGRWCWKVRSSAYICCFSASVGLLLERAHGVAHAAALFAR